ncbi:glucose-methanol-choline oxidoreductase [Diplodia corticola]|uniref:Glucose-methanol-choline oxidoreductase n=1 Tax=Diplodia corticola TaxID=236234 RepID=A0A1J9RQH3_9PEZI|nr:glucose-methanol-choline oxidoreductase [Diplodia corticola]OJD30148.1 glucose-methanol-choline oxidoreductase [Diplodia corticola]
MGSTTEKYDFIIVGSGPAGATLASRLSKAASKPRVLLLEAGGDNTEPSTLYLVNRFTTLMTDGMNWGYKTVPQEHLNGREIDYSRGKGLGGSSGINFACYTIGPRDDYDEWARQVGDESYNWTAAQRRYQALEDYSYSDVPDKYRKFVAPNKAAHGDKGPLQLEISKGAWEWSIEENYQAAEQAIGLKPNLDINSGNPLGIGVVPSTSRNSIRTTAKTAMLADAPSNLTILTNKPVDKVVFEGKKAVGVVAAGETFLASKEVVLSAGALDTPKILMLSGVGPSAELAKHSIPQLHELPGVGQNLQDHAFVVLVKQFKAGLSGRPQLFHDEAALAAAQKQFAQDQSGPLSMYYNTILMGWQQAPSVLASPEFAALPPAVQQHVRKPTVPTFEHICLCPAIHPAADPNGEFLSILSMQMVPQSKGTVTLASADPRAPPLCDPKLFSHPFDRANMIDAVRRSWAVMEAEPLARHVVADTALPKDKTDAEVWKYIQSYCNTTWHMTGTVKMGRPDDDEACVDTRFRVKGLQGLRVVDNSVPPFVLNCHVVSVAYLVGETAAEKMIEEYGL